MGPHHRKLLPAPPHPGITEPSAASPVVRRKRAAVRIACNMCRAKKTSCDGNRPSCDRCSQRGHACIYTTASRAETQRVTMEGHLARLQNQLKEQQDILQHLQSAPEAEALSILRRMKSTPNLEAVLFSIRSSIPPSKPSDVEAARATLPCIQSGSEFELAMLHGNAYPALADIDTSAINVKSIFGRRVGCSLPYAATNALLENYKVLADNAFFCNPTKGLVCGPPSPLRGTSSRSSSPFLGPLQDWVFYDPRLRHVRFQYWTRIPLNDEFAASLLSIYFENEHAIIGTFDASIFLDALVEGRLDFCSSFFVSSLLCLASLCFSSLDLRAVPLAIAFLNEAQSLWQAERSTDSVVNVSALITLGVATMMHGKDDISLELFSDARHMAERMSLLGVRHTHDLSQRFSRLHHTELRAFAHAAWGCYNWLSVHASYYKGEPIDFPPVFPIPSSCSTTPLYDLPNYHQPGCASQIFAEWCKLWTIAQEIQATYRRNSAIPLQDVIPYAFVEAKYQKLLTWADNLHHGMTRIGQEFPYVSVLHAYFHIIILDLFRPFLEAAEQVRLRSFSSQDASPKTIFDASLKQLQRIVLDYSSKYDPRFYNFIINGAVLHIMHVTLHNLDTSGWRLNLALGLGWMKEIYIRFAVIGKVAQAYMAIGLDTGMLSNEEAREFMDDLKLRGRHHNLADVAVSCIVDFGVAMSSQHDGRAQGLAERFDELALFDEFLGSPTA